MSKRKEAEERGRKFGVAESKYEFRCGDVPPERLYKSLDIIKIIFIHQIGNPSLVTDLPMS
jgi:hypothetical protein